MNNPIVIQMQVACYTSEKIKFPESLVSKLTEQKFTKIFNLDPSVLSVPDDENLAGIPIVTANSSTGDKLTITRTRVDYLMDGKKREISGLENEILEKALLAFDLANEKGEVSRIGFVLRFILPIEKPEEKLLNFLAISPMELPGGTSIHSGSIRYITNDKLVDFSIHNVTQIEKGNVTFPDKSKVEGILLTRDFNIPDKQKLNTEKLKLFITTSLSKLKLDDFISQLNK